MSFIRRLLKSKSSSSSSTSSSTSSSSSLNSSSGSQSTQARQRERDKDEEHEKRQKLARKLALAQSDPDSLLDLSDTRLDRFDSPEILSLVRVHHKTRLNFSTNLITSFDTRSPLCTVLANVTVIHLEENQIRHFRLSRSGNEALPALKELFLSSNRLESFEVSDFQLSLPSLRVLSLRGNSLCTFPLSILDSGSLNFVDLSHNRITRLPQEIATKRPPPPLLETLVVIEGNSIAHQIVKQLSIDDTADCFSQLRFAVAQHYSITIEQNFEPTSISTDQSEPISSGQSTESDGENEDETHNELEQRIVEYENQKNRARALALEFERNCINAPKPMVVNNGANSQNDDVGGCDNNNGERRRHRIVASCRGTSGAKEIEHENGKHLKNGSVPTDLAPTTLTTTATTTTIENNESVSDCNERASSTTNKALDELSGRDKLLVALAEEHSQLFERIHHFQHRKDVAKRALLDDCIRQLQEDFNEKFALLGRVTKEDDGRRIATNDNDDERVDEAVLRDALDKYALKLRTKHDKMVDHLVESDATGRDAIEKSSIAKGVKSSGMIAHITQQDAEMADAFQKIEQIRTARNGDYMRRIEMIEQQLLALSFLERSRKSDATESTLSELALQRAQLARLLRNLLEEKHARDKMLRMTVEREFERRFEREFGRTEHWFEEFQGFLGHEPFEIQLEHYDFDARVLDFVRFVRCQIDEDEDGGRELNLLVYNLPHFVDLKISNTQMQCHELLKLGIRDAQFCELLVRLFQEYSESQQQLPNAPIVDQNFEEETETDEERVSQEVRQQQQRHRQNQESGEVFAPETVVSATSATSSQSTRIWCESECVICLDSSANILFLPCGHVCTCRRCVRRAVGVLECCPLCRIEIDLMQPVHSSTQSPLTLSSKTTTTKKPVSVD